MHGCCNHRFVLKKVVQNSSVIIDPSCGALEIVSDDSTGSNGTKKGWVLMPPELFFFLKSHITPVFL